MENLNIDFNKKVELLKSLIEYVPALDMKWVKKNVLQFSKEDEIKLKRQERIDKLKKLNNDC